MGSATPSPGAFELLRISSPCAATWIASSLQTQTVTSAHAYRSLGIDNSYNFEDFAKDFRIEVTKLEDDVMEFDMVGVDPAIANAFRRIMISEASARVSPI